MHTKTMKHPERPQTADFGSLRLHPQLLSAVHELGFDQPTPIQAATIPPAVAGKDVLGCAMTGSGKTAAFLLPILERLRERPRGRSRALILTPTRELAAQIVAHLDELARHTRVRGAAIYGGVGMVPQERALRRGVDVLVATPGRLLDHLQYDYARLDGIEVLVLDEADRMLDMGFLPAIKRVLARLPKRPRQTLLFSATMPAPMRELARELLRDPVIIGTERKQTPPAAITQALYPVAAAAKPQLLVELLQRGEIGSAIVFCRTKHRADRLADKLVRQGVAVARIHGNRSQSQRTQALAGFKAGRFRVLVATDIVARGIDVDTLGHVVNFDVPAEPESYIHRIGRTARAGASGEAFTFVAREEEEQVRAIERALGRRIERRTIDGFDYRARATGPDQVQSRGDRSRRPERPRRAQRPAERTRGRRWRAA
ncbi:MAG: DEAD/DEAH box helicase [Longimicrobiales bacterium]